jgi:hypothetical protein
MAVKTEEEFINLVKPAEREAETDPDRIRLSRLRALAAFEQTGSCGGRLMRKFLYWYTPQFDAYSFVFRPPDEYQANAIAAEMASADTAIFFRGP